MEKTTELSQKDLLSANLSKKLTERSEEAQEIISRKPDFFEKWSLIIFMGLLVILLIGTWFVKYPDIIEANAVLSGYNAPKEIVPLRSGRLTHLFVENNTDVKKGDMIGWIESTANPEEILALSEKMNEATDLLNKKQSSSVSSLFRQRYTQLGELQNAYQTFVAALQQYNDYIVNGFYEKRKQLLYSDMQSLQRMKNKTNQQKQLQQEDNILSKESFDMNDVLLKEKVISEEEYRKAKSQYVNKQMSIPQYEANIISHETQIRDKQKEIDQLNHDIVQQQITFEQALHTLKSNVDEWIRNYVLQSPIDGRVVFAKPLQQNQIVEQGKMLGFITPPDTKYYAEVKLAQNNFGKVDTGMQIQLRFDAYPYQENGFVKGTLNYISNVAVDSNFIGTVKLDRGLVTNQNTKIPYKYGLKAQALIITKDMRLIERMYYNIVKATSMKK